VAAHRRAAVRARIEQLVAQRNDFRLLEALRVREQRAQLERGQLADLLLAPLRDPAPGQDRCGTGVFHLAGPLYGLDVGGARTLGALLDLVLHLVVLLQGLEPARLDGREVHEEILAAVIGRDEAEALGVVEPLYGTCIHACFLDIGWKEGRIRKKGGPAENQEENQPTRTVQTATTRPATRCLRILLYPYTGIRARSPISPNPGAARPRPGCRDAPGRRLCRRISAGACPRKSRSCRGCPSSRWRCCARRRTGQAGGRRRRSWSAPPASRAG